jgi:AcrR family transcriptional regulator
MNTQYVSPLRQHYAAQTRERIVDAAIAELEQGALESLTIAGVAKAAGITERTVYRHFATREELLQAVWPRMQARIGLKGYPQTVAALLETPAKIFPRFDAEEGVVRASMASSAGQDIRKSANPQRQAAMLACVREALPKLDKDARRRRAAVIQMIGSAHGWACMKDYWGLSAEDAARAAREAMALLLEQEPKKKGKTP